MKVSFHATLRMVAGAKTGHVALPEGATVGQLLEAVLEKHPAMRDHLLDHSGRLLRHVHLLINGRDAPYLELGMETPLAPDDSIDLFPAVGGG